MKNQTRHAGIGLLELMLSLAVIAILIVMVTRYYVTTRTSQQINQAAEMVVAVYSAGQSWLQSNDNFSGDMIQNFVKDGSVPSDFSSPAANPWGSYIKASQGSGPTMLHVEMGSVPKAACENLKAKVSEKIAGAQATCGSSDPTTFTVDLDMVQ